MTCLLFDEIGTHPKYFTMISIAPFGSPLSYLSIFAIVLAVVGVALVIAGLIALRRARPWRFTMRVLLGGLLIAVGALAGAIAVGVQGYTALTRESVAARITVQPIAPQRFQANFHFPDGATATYELAGDEIYVDAHILKWKPIAGMIGLHTLWSLDRVAGRYRSIEQERSGARTVYRLSNEPTINLFALRQRFVSLAPLYDAEYGSASFVPADSPVELELRVSPSGLLLRPVAKVVQAVNAKR